MSYSCSDFTSDVFTAFVEAGLISKRAAARCNSEDNPSRAADLCFAAITRAQHHKEVLMESLNAWEGEEPSVQLEHRKLITKIKRALR